MSNNEEATELTLEDIESAIRILETFTKRYEKAVRLLSRLSRGSSGRQRIEDMIFEMALSQALGKRIGEQQEESEEPELTQEELETFRRRAKELLKKLK